MDDSLRGQLLGQASRLSMVETVEALAGLNAQTARGPSVGLWTRMPRFDQAELTHRLGRYELVMANLMRGTVHLVTRRQYCTWRLALQPVLERTFNGFTPRFWQTVDRDRLFACGRELLLANEGLTRAEIGAALAPTFPDVEPRRLGFAIRMLLPVVQVPSESAWRPERTRYVLAEQAFDEPLRPDHEGLPDLVGSFQRAFGSASAADAAYWSGASRLAPYVSADVEREHDEEPRRAFVLPEYDNLYFCSKDSSRPLIAAKKRLLHGPALMDGTLVSDGEVCATWRAEPRSTALVLTPWRELDEGERAEFGRFRAWYDAQT